MRKPMPFGKYLLLDRIAVGGMAEVFGAKAFGVEGFERIVAIKRILPNMVEDDEFIAMFIDEARIASLLNHANIATIYELGRHDEAYFIAMEYVSGRDIRLLIDKFKKRGQTVPFPMAAYILARMAEGLDYAHTRRDQHGQPLGIIHRDISPQNVLVSYDGDVKIIDFGIAKVSSRHQKTEAGILKGKFAYMSPEQVRGQSIDHRADLYSAGVMLYEMVTGTKLFSGESDFSTLEKVRAGTVRRPSEVNAKIPAELEKILLKALATDRDDRYQTGAELHDDLMRYVFSEKDVFSGKNLASFMKDAFAEEFRKEQDRIRRWQETSADDSPDFEPTRFSKTTTGPKQKVRIGAPASEDAAMQADEPTPVPTSLQEITRTNTKAPPPPPVPDEESVSSENATQLAAPDEVIQKEITKVPVKGAPKAPQTKEQSAPPAEEQQSVAETKPTPPPKPAAKAPIAVALALLVLGGVGAVAYLQFNKKAPSVVISVRNAPKDVKIFVDGTLQSEGHPEVTVQTKPGTHALRVEAPGFKDIDSTLSLTSGQENVELTLERIAAPPPDVPTPVVDAADAGATETTIATNTTVDAGTPRTAKSTPDAGTGREVISTKPDAGTPAAPNPSPTPAVATKGSLIIESAPPGAMITVNGRAVSGKTPVTIPDLPVGQSVAVKFVLKGYSPKEATQVVTGKSDRLSVALDAIAVVTPTPTPQSTPSPTPTPTPSPAPAVAADGKTILKIVCYPQARVFVDDKKVGQTQGTTALAFETTPGAHKVVCETDAGARSAKDVMVAAGETKSVGIRITQ
jgi:serine/threonine protein kinase